MKDNTLSKLGGNCSILLGILYLVIGVTYLLLPEDQTERSPWIDLVSITAIKGASK